MSASAQRLLLSFIYIHREEIPPSAFTNFINSLTTAVSILPTAEWIKVLLNLLKSFCLEKKYCSGGVCMDVRKQSEAGDGSDANQQSAGMPEDICSKQTLDNAHSDFDSLKDDVLIIHNDSSLLQPYHNFPAFKGLQAEAVKDSEFCDMETETTEEFPDVSTAATNQLENTENQIKKLSQTPTGMHLNCITFLTSRLSTVDNCTGCNRTCTFFSCS